MSFNEALVAS